MTTQDIIKQAEAAIIAKDWAAYGALIADDVKWFTPLFDDPVIGKQAMLAMQPVVLGEVFDDFSYADIGYGDRYAYMHFVGHVEGVAFVGTDRVVVEGGKLTEFHVDGRTLNAMTHFGSVVQRVFAERGLLPA
jgi:hypothetical protein